MVKNSAPAQWNSYWTHDQEQIQLNYKQVQDQQETERRWDCSESTETIEEDFREWNQWGKIYSVKKLK